MNELPAMLLVGITAIVSAATFPETLPASPSNMASALEHRLVSGEGMIYPGSDAESRTAPAPALLDGTWPDAFLDRIGETIDVRVSPVTGCYEFSDEAGTVFWVEVPVAPHTWNWIAPFRRPFAPPDEDLSPLAPWHLADRWVLSTEAREATRGPASRGAPRRRSSPPAAATNLVVAAFAVTNDVLFFTAAWPTNEALPDAVLDVWCSTNLSEWTWTNIWTAPATSPPSSFAFSRELVPNHGLVSSHVHGPDCSPFTNVVVSPLDGTTVYTNAAWSCETNRTWLVEPAFFRLGTRTDNDDDGLVDAWEKFVFGTNPDSLDTDGDGLGDGAERLLGTDPLDPDTDGDTMPDGWEISNGLDPLDYYDSLLDPDSDGLVNVYEFHAETDPAVSDYEQAYKLTVGTGGEVLTLEEAFRDSWPYAILEIRPGVYEGTRWENLYVPAHPVLVTTSNGGRSRSVMLRMTGNALSVFLLDSEQTPHTMFQGLDVELAGKTGHQSAFWLGDGSMWHGPGASAFFKNVHVKLGSAPAPMIGWKIRHSTGFPTILANCTVDAVGSREAIGVYAIDSPELVFENCSFFRFPDAEHGRSYGVQTESTIGNLGAAASPIPITLKNVLFDDSFTNALAIAPLEYGVHYWTVLQNCIIPSELEYPVAATNATIVASSFCEPSGHLPTNSPAVDAGAPVLFAATDFDGELRDSAPDIGSDECLLSSDTDTDGDGLFNYEERSVYGTDPFRFDTDGDGVSDGDEIAEGTDPLDDASVCFVLSGLLSGVHPEAAGAKLAIASTNGTSVALLSQVLSIAGTNAAFSFPHLSVTNVSERLLCLFYDLDSDDVPDETESIQFERIALNGHETHLDAAFRVLTATSDLDGDGIPDLWELVHGLSNTNSVDAFEDWDDDGLINLHEYWMDGDPFLVDGTNSILVAITRSVDSRLEGADADFAWPVYDNYVSNAKKGHFERNTNCWAFGIDFSCASPWNTGDFGNWRAGTLVSPRHFIMAEHFLVPMNSKLVFHAVDGTVVSNRYIAKRRIGETDITIGLLESEVPSCIHPAKLLPPDYVGYLGTGAELPVFVLDQDENAMVVEMRTLSSGFSNPQSYTKSPRNQLRCSFFDDLVRYDSGNPRFFVVGSEVILLSTMHGPHSGDSLADQAEAIQAAMDDLCPGYSLQFFDMSGFEKLHNLP